MSLKRAIRNARRTSGYGVEHTPMVAAPQAEVPVVGEPSILTFDRTEEFVDLAMASRPTAGVDAQLAEVMRLSKGCVNPTSARELIRRKRDGH